MTYAEWLQMRAAEVRAASQRLARSGSPISDEPAVLIDAVVRVGGIGLEHAAGERDTAIADPGLPGARDELARLELVHAAERAGLRNRAHAQQSCFHARRL